MKKVGVFCFIVIVFSGIGFAIDDSFSFELKDFKYSYDKVHFSYDINSIYSEERLINLEYSVYDSSGALVRSGSEAHFINNRGHDGEFSFDQVPLGRYRVSVILSDGHSYKKVERYFDLYNRGFSGFVSLGDARYGFSLAIVLLIILILFIIFIRFFSYHHRKNHRIHNTFSELQKRRYIKLDI